MLLFVLIVGIVIGAGWTFFDRHIYQSMLYKKGKETENRTAECLRGEFFYIVPEDEYIELRSRK